MDFCKILFIIYYKFKRRKKGNYEVKRKKKYVPNQKYGNGKGDIREGKVKGEKKGKGFLYQLLKFCMQIN